MTDSVPATPHDGPPNRPWLGADERIRIDIPCQHCRYDLRTLKPDGICPECGHPVSDSAHDELLRFSSSRWVKRLRLGALLLLVGIAALMGGIFVTSRLPAHVPQKIGETVPPQRRLAIVQQLSSAIREIIALVALVLLSTRDPATQSAESRHSPRLLLRTCLPVLCVFLLLDILQAFAGIALYGWAALARTVAFDLVSAIALVAFLQHVINLLRRVPCRWLIRFAQTELWVGILVLAAFLVSAVAAYAAYPAMAAGPPYASKAPPRFPPGRAVTSFPSPTTPLKTEYIIVDESGAMTRSTTVPASVPIMHASGSAFWGTLNWMVCTYGMYVTLLWAIAGIVLVVLAERTLARAARQAAELEKLPQVASPSHDFDGEPSGL